jgi:hypothetical protein
MMENPTNIGKYPEISLKIQDDFGTILLYARKKISLFKRVDWRAISLILCLYLIGLSRNDSF